MADYDVNAKLDAYRQSMKKKEEILSQLQQGVVNTQAEIHMLTGAIQALEDIVNTPVETCLLYTSPSPRDQRGSRIPSSA